MTETSTDVELSPALLAKFADMVTIVPDYETGGGEAILAAILSSKSLTELEAPWTGGRDLPLNRPYVYQAIAKAPSDFGAGLPFYLVCTVIDPTNGETKEFTTGSISIVGQLVAAHSMGQFPIRAVAVESDKPSRNGYRPQHLTEITHEEPAPAAKRGK